MKYLLLASFMTRVGWTVVSTTPADEVAFYPTKIECVAAIDAYAKENKRIVDKAVVERDGNFIEARGYCSTVPDDAVLKSLGSIAKQ